MISAASQFDAAVVADHYNELDIFYRELWGEHVHHGLWVNGQESPEVAVCHLVDVVAKEAQIKPGDHVIDIGCGYGAAARQLAQHYGAEVTAITLSSAQHAYAQSVTAGANPVYLIADWLTTDFPQSFDSAIAIESSEHMPDRDEFFRRAYRVLEAGGRFVVCAWLSGETPSSLEVAWLLQPICDEGRVPHLPTLNELTASAREAGFKVVNSQDLNISVGIENQEWKVYIDSMNRTHYSILRGGWGSGIADPIGFLQIWTTGNPNNRTNWGSPAYDELINQAAATADPVQRFGLLRQAETILLEAAPIIPIYWYTRTYLLDPSVQNWHPVLLDSHPPKFLDLEAPQTGMMR